MRRWVVLLLIVSAVGSVVGRMVWRQVRGVEVDVEPATRGRVVEAVYATGRVDTDRRATVRARRAAPLLEVLVGPGEAVRAGQLVARQDARESRLAVERAEAELAAARAALAEAQDAAGRAEELHRSGLLPENEWVRQRERARELIQRSEALASALALAKEQATWIELRAPLAGVVSALHRRSGDVLREGDEVMTIVDLSTAYLRVAVDERDLGRIRTELPARVVFDAYPELLLDSQVWRIVPAVDRLTKSADVLVALPAASPPLQLDMTATVNLVVAVVDGAVVLPRDALLGSGVKRQVLQIDDRQRVAARTVRVGLCDPERCQIVEGLAEGDGVIAAPTGLVVGGKVRRR